MLKLTAALVMAAALSGCESFAYVDETYGKSPIEKVSYRGETWTVQDNRSASRMIVSGSTGRAFMEGASFGLSAAPGTIYRDAAIQYLKDKGRNCQAAAVTPVIDMTYEVSYLCS